jgi:hypothetical protein
MQLLGASNVRELIPEMVSPVVTQHQMQTRVNLSLGRTDQLAASITYAS